MLLMVTVRRTVSPKIMHEGTNRVNVVVQCKRD